MVDASDDTRTERRPNKPRRRARRPRVFDTSVASPCISVCQVDSATDLCIGCLRHIDEIRDWPILSAEEKQAILTRCAERKAAG